MRGGMNEDVCCETFYELLTGRCGRVAVMSVTLPTQLASPCLLTVS